MPTKALVKQGQAVANVGHQDETDVTQAGSYVVLVQKTSKIKDEHSELKDGQIVDKDMNKLNGKPFIPIFKYNIFTKFIPINEGGGVEWKTTDSKDQRVLDGLVWKKDKKGTPQKPEVQKSINIIAVYNHDFENPVVLVFKSTSIKIGAAIVKQAIKDEGIFKRYYALDSIKMKGKGSTPDYFVYTLKTSEKFVKGAQAKLAQGLYNKALEDYERMAAMLGSEGDEVPF